MLIQAHANYIRMSPRKVRLVADMIRGLHVRDAETQLRFVRKKASPILLKVLKSAIANAEALGTVDQTTLVVKRMTVDGGPTLKRFKPRAFGRATPIRRRSSHISIVLEGKEGVGGRRREEAKSKETKVAPHHEWKETQGVAQHGQHDAHRPEAIQPGRLVKRAEPRSSRPSETKKSKGFFRTLFSRKTG